MGIAVFRECVRVYMSMQCENAMKNCVSADFEGPRVKMSVRCSFFCFFLLCTCVNAGRGGCEKKNADMHACCTMYMRIYIYIYIHTHTCAHAFV
jgi:hypothetical protein